MEPKVEGRVYHPPPGEELLIPAGAVDAARNMGGTTACRLYGWRRSCELGVTGVPTFVIGNRGLVGAQPYEQLAGFVESAGAARRSR